VSGRVALASTAVHADIDEDLPAIAAALRARDVAAVVADWHDEGVDWAGVDLVVIRSTWDYARQLDDFLAWVDRVAATTRIVNPAPVVRWNTDKRYLLDLAAAGVPTVPTRILAPGDGPSPAGAVREVAAGGAVVVKPAVSAGAVDTDRYGPDEVGDAEAHAAGLLGQGRSVLVQPYVTGIDDRGETGLVYLGDVFSHAFVKGPILRPGVRSAARSYEEDIAARVASPEEHALAEAALDAVATAVPGLSRRDLLYARVDMAPHVAGPVLLELELVEPALFCSTGAGAVDRVADAVLAALRTPGG
jgi:hypothetical protein